ncbi:hypothetical protein IJG72_04100 [bacterium]|nr:hypothetical protein [bacterium]
MNEAHNRATAVYGPIEKWSGGDSNLPKRYFDRITEFMKIQKSCRNSANNCMSNKYKRLHTGLGTWNNFDGSPSAITVSSWSFKLIKESESSNCTTTTKTGYDGISCGINIYVDINGPQKGKNAFGIDTFVFDVTRNGVQPLGGGKWWNDDYMNSGNGTPDGYSDCFRYGTICAAWVINTGNMDYIDISHDTATEGKCNNNGKTLSVTYSVFSCK